MIASKILLFALPILPIYAASFECQWPGHCVGAQCSSYDDCSDDLTCEDGQCLVANAPVDPFTISLSTWNRHYCTFAPEGCHHDCEQWSRCYDFTDLLVTGEHFNVGTGNIQLEVRDEASNTLVWSTIGNAREDTGKVRGSFRMQTPLGASFALSETNAYVKVLDIESGQWSEPEYFAYLKDADQ
ncbi:uncharacterized protein BDR25DRAFT_306489 [Lindgomyces ingoldianus]|uniref:Uncharacterized protein n=1 Tax=Lindgomyces ingoldianus TaxID=673940 RepID=A0ACB6QFI8_9PLEO|nr:uncharacterized protein BDR25DRAFT_306489 [Lindgomyces ingoldianus]KAF2465691.1 hypothetical protein BDR25DRAFT_306489 [Lindgomyces ingoldianus]